MQGHNNAYEERNKNKDGTPKPNGAEIAFEALAEKQEHWTFERWGFDEKKAKLPTKEFIKIPEILRSFPDYLLVDHRKERSYLIEVKAFKDVFKLKINDLENYNKWREIIDHRIGFGFFVYDYKKKKHSFIDMNTVNELVKTGKLKIGKYDDNNQEYYEVPLTHGQPI